MIRRDPTRIELTLDDIQEYHLRGNINAKILVILLIDKPHGSAFNLYGDCTRVIRICIT